MLQVSLFEGEIAAKRSYWRRSAPLMEETASTSNHINNQIYTIESLHERVPSIKDKMGALKQHAQSLSQVKLYHTYVFLCCMIKTIIYILVDIDI